MKCRTLCSISSGSSLFAKEICLPVSRLKMFHCCLFSAGIRCIIMLWGQNTSVMLQLLHVGYGVGALLVPIIVNPFLAVIKYKDEQGNHQSETFEVVEESRVHYAFVGVGVGSFLLALAFYYFQYRGTGDYKQVPTDEDANPKNSQSLPLRDMLNPATYADGSFGFGIYMFVVLFVFYFNMTGSEEVFGHFVRSFSVDSFKFSKTQASYLNMVYWLSLTIARLFMSVISHYIPIRRLFKMQVFLHLVSTTMLNIYASRSAASLWMCTILQGVAISPLYPSGIAYGNTQMNITGVCLMVIVFAGSSGDLAYIWVAGKLYDTYGPSAILFALWFTGFVLMLCVVLFRFVERSEKDRKANLKPSSPFKCICNKCS